MKKISSISICALLMLMMAAGCKKEDLTAPADRTTLPRNMGEFIENNYDLSILKAALIKTGMMNDLKQPGAFTMFAPDNKAFNQIGITEESIAAMNTDSLKFILQYHLIADRYYVSNFPVQLDNVYKTQNGKELYVSISKQQSQGANNKDTYVNGVPVMPEAKRNIPLSNGVLHILFRPLNISTGTVQDYIASRSELSLFAAIMKKFNHWDDLKSKPLLTVYAPVNDAFLAYGLTADSIAKINPATFNPLVFDVYLLQMKSARVFASDAATLTENGTQPISNGIMIQPDYAMNPGYTFSTYNFTEIATLWIYKKAINGIWDVNPHGNATVYYAGGLNYSNKLNSNGVVHTIDQLIFDPARFRK
ncbi:fasciclin domain-containing protein [Pseudoflavitalea sp. G-6-1-2]|uniref:fasciclin domain-containing protein n=1 Tax=Pseudoflavitalea sp. G-6-1-2 TaxID=2728841 RepID=UPI00146F87D2|nr:fasciclin domain-containing protein [Pseudoflavitalea sp. G-6-1-2]NML23591.1 fasciclin domain-containing protein [Pseudoflavitalea sp. G-6-1-2]